MAVSSTPPPTAAQVRHTTAVVTWYLAEHHADPQNPGFPKMYCDANSVGPLAVEPDELRRGDGDALYRCLVATFMFQRLRDDLTKRILRQLTVEEANELAAPHRLLALADSTPCPHLRTVASLRSSCDLSKDPETKRGVCHCFPDLPCYLKRHTERLRRYGHFGKVPTSIALVLREEGVVDLPELYLRAITGRNSQDAAEWIEAELSKAWRINKKLASMFLSLVANPDVTRDAPWRAGLAWEHFVVVDVNVDQFLVSIGYRGHWTYDARREFVMALARCIDLSSLRPDLQAYNPRIVQQAAFLFMSTSNRRTMQHDCIHAVPTSCASCHADLHEVCPTTRQLLREKGARPKSRAQFSRELLARQPEVRDA